MEVSRRVFLGDAATFAAFAALSGCTSRTVSGRAASGRISPLEKADGYAPAPIMARRLYLDIAGRLPTPAEVRAYEQDDSPGRKAALVDRLLESEGFADYWSMRFCDILRVKSEFPINLWPNAVYVYHRRIRSFVKADEPWDDFAAALLGASGSNFRVPEVNFMRAVAQRTPEGLSRAASLTFLGEASERYADYFSRVSYKGTREWKEEIVYLAPGDGPAPADFARLLKGRLAARMAEAAVSRVAYWLFPGHTLEDRDAYVDLFRASGCRLKPLLRAMLLSDAYARGSVTGGFPRRRLDAEVLEDAICDITYARRNHQSIAPEPFTFLPPTRRSICIEDGSITSSFLLLFGRPARDSGEMSERDNRVTAKQRLHLFNSGRLFSQLTGLAQFKAVRQMKPAARIDYFYRLFLARKATPAERKFVLASQMAPRDLAWCLINTREFLYRC